MKETLDISVIIPYFRSSETIDRALKSIMNQTKLPKEIIVVDDFSNKDEDQKILTKIDNIERVHVIYSKKNLGPGGARNLGIDKARGKYLAFLDSDDIWTDQKLEEQYKFMEENNAFLSGHLTSIYNTEEKNKDSFNIINKRKQFIKNRFPTRSVMMENNKKYKFKEDKRHSEDFLLWSQIVLDGKKSLIINKTLAHSFKEDFGESGLTANTMKMYLGAIDAYKILFSEGRINKFELTVLIFYQSIKQIFREIKMIIRKLNRK